MRGSQVGILLGKGVLQVDAGNIVPECETEIPQVPGEDEHEAEGLRSALQ